RVGLPDLRQGRPDAAHVRRARRGAVALPRRRDRERGMIELLQHAVTAAKAAGATDVEVSHAGRTLGAARFANSYVTQSGIVVERATRVRAAVGQRIGAATTTGADAGALAEAARQAVRAAGHSPEQPKFPGFARGTQSVAASTAAAPYGPDERAAVLERVFARAARDRLLCAGSFTTGPRVRAVVTAGGVAVEHRADE